MGPHGTAAIARPDGLGAVLDERHTESEQPIEVGRQSEHVRDDDGLRAQGQAPFDVLRVQVEGRRVDLGHDRRSSGDGHGVQQRRADETRDHDFVARTDPHGSEGQVQGRRA